jgi:hypothetical protein
LKKEKDPKQVWKILDEAGLINGENYEFDEEIHTDRATIIDILFVTYIVEEEDDLFMEDGHEAFLKTHGDRLNRKYSEIRKALSMKSLQTTLDCACSPNYLKGARSLAPLHSAITLTKTLPLAPTLTLTLTLTFTLTNHPNPHPGHR